MAGQRFFQIWKDDGPADQRTYPSHGQAALDVTGAPGDNRVIEIDVLDRPIRKYSREESKAARLDFLRIIEKI